MQAVENQGNIFQNGDKNHLAKDVWGINFKCFFVQLVGKRRGSGRFLCKIYLHGKKNRLTFAIRLKTDPNNRRGERGIWFFELIVAKAGQN